MNGCEKKLNSNKFFSKKMMKAKMSEGREPFVLKVRPALVVPSVHRISSSSSSSSSFFLIFFLGLAGPDAGPGVCVPVWEVVVVSVYTHSVERQGAQTPGS